jgi:hypothetical protein
LSHEVICALPVWYTNSDPHLGQRMCTPSMRRISFGWIPYPHFGQGLLKSKSCGFVRARFMEKILPEVKHVLDLQQQAVGKWDGHRPQVEGSGSGMLLNVSPK